MSTKHVTMEQLSAVLRVDFEEMVEASEGALFRAALKGVRPVVEDTPTDRGQAKAGWDVRRVKGGADLYNDVPYIGVLESGSRPHRPPMMPIIEWVVRKFGLNLELIDAGGSDEDGKKAMKRAKKSFESIKDVPWRTYRFALAIVEKIEREGSEPHYMVKNNLDKLEAIAKSEVEKALGSL